MVLPETQSAPPDACCRGDREALHSLFLAHKDSVYSVALRFTADASAASDITQDVFLKLFSRIGTFRGESRIETWLYRITINCCLDHRRRSARFVPLVDDQRTSAESTPAEQAEAAEVGRRLQAAVVALPEDLRTVIVLRYTEDLSYEEIAEVLECAAGTVASRLNRAHKRLAELLGGRND